MNSLLNSLLARHDQVSSFLCQHDHGRIGVGVRYFWNDRCVHHTKVSEADHSEIGIHHSIGVIDQTHSVRQTCQIETVLQHNSSLLCSAHKVVVTSRQASYVATQIFLTEEVSARLTTRYGGETCHIGDRVRFQ